jgi:heme-degrading monooxygenase HmoA
MEVAPDMQPEFEQVWRDGTGVIAAHPANLAHWLSRSNGRDGIYYIVSDWTDEESFREFERSEKHLEHRARLHPYRITGAFETMCVLASVEPARTAREQA